MVQYETLFNNNLILPSLQIISATPGLTTNERLMQLLEASPQGLTIREMSQRLNRPVSMLQICLNHLLGSQQVVVRQEEGRLRYSLNNR